MENLPVVAIVLVFALIIGVVVLNGRRTSTSTDEKAALPKPAQKIPDNTEFMGQPMEAGMEYLIFSGNVTEIDSHLSVFALNTSPRMLDWPEGKTTADSSFRDWLKEEGWVLIRETFTPEGPYRYYSRTRPS